MLVRSFCLTSTVLVFCLWMGCSGAQSRLAQPGIDKNAGRTAVAKYDSNADGAISGQELDKVPAIKSTLKRVDKNGDGRVTAEEIDDRIAAWRNSGVALTRLTVTVRQNGRPLPDAQVTIVPESFLGPSVKPAAGTTDSAGSVNLRISDHPDEAGVHLGYYRVEVSKKRADGSETIPARYNAETEVGMEITMDDPSSDRLSIDMKGT